MTCVFHMILQMFEHKYNGIETIESKRKQKNDPLYLRLDPVGISHISYGDRD